MSEGILVQENQFPYNEHNYLTHNNTVWGWLTTLDHKKIGLMYLFSIMVFFLVGGIFAELVRMELFTAGPTITSDPSQYNRFFTYHGAIMVFLVIIPSIPAAIGNFVMPMMVGAKDV